MSQVPIQDFFYSSGIGSASTTGKPDPTLSASSATDDGGTVAKLAKLWGGGISSHSNTSELVKNILPYRGGSICGHGNKGMFETGDGQWGYSDDGQISYENEHAWKEHIAKLWKPIVIAYDARNRPHNSFGGIDIIACCVAGDMNGMNLIQKISDLTNCWVRAYTGLIYVVYDVRTGRGLNVLYEKGHKHVRVYPTGSVHDFQSSQQQIENINFHIPSNLINKSNMQDIGFSPGMEINDVDSILIKTRKNGKLIERLFPPEIADLLYKELFFSKPFQKSGSVIGMATASCTINYRSQPPLVVKVFSDGIAETTHGGESFIVSRNFRQMIDQIFSH